MMYSEFIDRTTYSETYMTCEDYVNYIEPVYMNGSESKDAFCKRFYKMHKRLVSDPVSMMILAKTTEALEAFICGNESVMEDTEAINQTLKAAFLKGWLKTNGNIEKRL